MGIDIKIHFTWFFIFILISWTLAVGFMPQQFPNLSPMIYWVIGIVSALLLFLSVLFHELFHSYVALKQGIPVPNITLFLFGGVSQIGEEPRSSQNEFKLSIVGPLSSFALGVILGAFYLFFAYLNASPLIVAPLQYGSLINFLLGGFNLLPAFPLDGGRVLRAYFWRRRNDIIKATMIATRIGTFFAYGFMALGILIFILPGGLISGIWLIFIGWFLKNGSDSSLKQTITTQALSDVNIDEIMNPNVVSITSDITINEAIDNYFYKYKHGGFPVLDGDELKGIITVDDIKKIPKGEYSKTYVKDVMTKSEKLIVIGKKDSAMEAMLKFSKHNVGRFPVLEENKLVGILTRSDLMRAIKLRTQLKT
jgi:Zn-dependent protease